MIALVAFPVVSPSVSHPSYSSIHLSRTASPRIFFTDSTVCHVAWTLFVLRLSGEHGLPDFRFVVYDCYAFLVYFFWGFIVDFIDVQFYISVWSMNIFVGTYLWGFIVDSIDVQLYIWAWSRYLWRLFWRFFEGFFEKPSRFFEGFCGDFLLRLH